MKSDWTDTDLAVLGLVGLELGELESIRIPGGETAQGKALLTSATLAAVAASALNAGAFVQVPSETARAVGVSLFLHQDNPSLACAEPASATPIDIRCRHHETRVSRGDADPELILVDLDEGPVVIVVGNGRRLVVARMGSALQITPASPPSAGAPPLGDLSAPVDSWAEQTGDAWLQAQVSDRLAANGGWQLAVAAGMTARLAEPASAEDARRIVERTLAGEVVRSLVQARRWAQGLRAEQKKRLEDAALMRADALVGEMHQLDLELALDDPSWVGRLDAACGARDDLQCVRLLLREGGTGDRLAAALRSLDAEGLAFVETLPRDVKLDDERLRRVTLADPDAWWGRLALLEV